MAYKAPKPNNQRGMMNPPIEEQPVAQQTTPPPGAPDSPLRSAGETTTPPAETPAPKTQAQIQGELDYRDLLSSQIMSEQAKANASKYIMGSLQSAGVAQTGLSQSILAGLETGYQSSLAQNVNQYMMTQEQRMLEGQSTAINTATTLLTEPDLTQEEMQYIWDNYYNQMSPEDQKTFKFVYDRTAREYGYSDSSGTTPTGTFNLTNEDQTILFDEYGVDYNTDQEDDVNNWDGVGTGTLTIGGMTEKFKANDDFGRLMNLSKNWKNDRNGYIVKIKGWFGDQGYYLMWYKGKWLNIRKSIAETKTVKANFLAKDNDTIQLDR